MTTRLTQGERERQLVLRAQWRVQYQSLLDAGVNAQGEPLSESERHRYQRQIDMIDGKIHEGRPT